MRGTDNQLHQKSWTPSTSWTAFNPLGGALTSTPEGTAWAGNRRDVFVRGPDGVVYDRSWTASGGWQPFGRLPGVVSSAPAATAVGPGRCSCSPAAASGSSPTATPGSWSGWQNFSEIPPTPPAPAPAARRAGPVAGRAAPARRLRLHPGRRPRAGAGPVYQRTGRLKPRVVKVVFFIDRGKRKRVDRHTPYKTRMRVTYKRGSKHRVHARIYFKRKGSKRVQRKTISKRFTMCRGR